MHKFAQAAALIPMLILLNLGAASCADACEQAYGDDYVEVPDNELTGSEGRCASYTDSGDLPIPD